MVNVVGVVQSVVTVVQNVAAFVHLGGFVGFVVVVDAVMVGVVGMVVVVAVAGGVVVVVVADIDYYH